MTVDNLVAADVVTADGNLLHVSDSDSENPDLFWAIRGGSGNFGVVTNFEFRLHPVGPGVLTGLIVYPASEAVSALKQYRTYAATLGDDTNVWVVLRKAPPLPFLPASAHGKDVIVFAFFHAGAEDAGRKVAEPLRKFGTVLGEFIGVQPYTAWQQAFDPLLTPGARNYWKSHNFIELSDGAITTAVQFAGTVPSPQCEIFFGMVGAATGRVAVDATAYPHRNANWVLNVHGRWDTAGEDDKCIAWAREFFRASAPYATGGVYVNFLTADETDRVRAAYGPSYDRLAAAKKKYDPNNLFRVNQNISPKA